MQKLVLYKGVDGLFAAWAARKAMGDYAMYFRIDDRNHAPSVYGKDVYILGFTPSNLAEMAPVSRSMILIDTEHRHEHGVLQPVRSGAKKVKQIRTTTSANIMAWKQFNPDQPVPDVLRDASNIIAYGDADTLWDTMLAMESPFEVIDSMHRPISWMVETAHGA